MASRKSSILKPRKERVPLQDLNQLIPNNNDEETTTTEFTKRRVSFASTNKVKEFESAAECVALKHAPVYDERFSISSDSCQSSMLNTSSVELAKSNDNRRFITSQVTTANAEDDDLEITEAAGGGKIIDILTKCDGGGNSSMELTTVAAILDGQIAAVNSEASTKPGRLSISRQKNQAGLNVDNSCTETSVIMNSTLVDDFHSDSKAHDQSYVQCAPRMSIFGPVGVGTPRKSIFDSNLFSTCQEDNYPASLVDTSLAESVTDTTSCKNESGIVEMCGIRLPLPHLGVEKSPIRDFFRSPVTKQARRSIPAVLSYSDLNRTTYHNSSMQLASQNFTLYNNSSMQPLSQEFQTKLVVSGNIQSFPGSVSSQSQSQPDNTRFDNYTMNFVSQERAAALEIAQVADMTVETEENNETIDMSCTEVDAHGGVGVVISSDIENKTRYSTQSMLIGSQENSVSTNPQCLETNQNEAREVSERATGSVGDDLEVDLVSGDVSMNKTRYSVVNMQNASLELDNQADILSNKIRFSIFDSQAMNAMAADDIEANQTGHNSSELVAGTVAGDGTMNATRYSLVNMQNDSDDKIISDTFDPDLIDEKVSFVVTSAINKLDNSPPTMIVDNHKHYEINEKYPESTCYAGNQNIGNEVAFNQIKPSSTNIEVDTINENVSTIEKNKIQNSRTLDVENKKSLFSTLPVNKKLEGEINKNVLESTDNLSLPILNENASTSSAFDETNAVSYQQIPVYCDLTNENIENADKEEEANVAEHITNNSNADIIVRDETMNKTNYSAVIMQNESQEFEIAPMVTDELTFSKINKENVNMLNSNQEFGNKTRYGASNMQIASQDYEIATFADVFENSDVVDVKAKVITRSPTTTITATEHLNETDSENEKLLISRMLQKSDESGSSINDSPLMVGVNFSIFQKNKETRVEFSGTIDSTRKHRNKSISNVQVNVIENHKQKKNKSVRELRYSMPANKAVCHTSKTFFDHSELEHPPALDRHSHDKGEIRQQSDTKSKILESTVFLEPVLLCESDVPLERETENATPISITNKSRKRPSWEMVSSEDEDCDFLPKCPSLSLSSANANVLAQEPHYRPPLTPKLPLAGTKTIIHHRHSFILEEKSVILSGGGQSDKITKDESITATQIMAEQCIDNGNSERHTESIRAEKCITNISRTSEEVLTPPAIVIERMADQKGTISEESPEIPPGPHQSFSTMEEIALGCHSTPFHRKSMGNSTLFEDDIVDDNPLNNPSIMVNVGDSSHYKSSLEIGTENNSPVAERCSSQEELNKAESKLMKNLIEDVAADNISKQNMVNHWLHNVKYSDSTTTILEKCETLKKQSRNLRQHQIGKEQIRVNDIIGNEKENPIEKNRMYVGEDDDGRVIGKKLENEQQVDSSPCADPSILEDAKENELLINEYTSLVKKSNKEKISYVPVEKADFAEHSTFKKIAKQHKENVKKNDSTFKICCENSLQPQTESEQISCEKITDFVEPAEEILQQDTKINEMRENVADFSIHTHEFCSIMKSTELYSERDATVENGSEIKLDEGEELEVDGLTNICGSEEQGADNGNIGTCPLYYDQKGVNDDTICGSRADERRMSDEEYITDDGGKLVIIDQQKEDLLQKGVCATPDIKTVRETMNSRNRVCDNSRQKAAGDTGTGTGFSSEDGERNRKILIESNAEFIGLDESGFREEGNNFLVDATILTTPNLDNDEILHKLKSYLNGMKQWIIDGVTSETWVFKLNPCLPQFFKLIIQIIPDTSDCTGRLEFSTAIEKKDDLEIKKVAFKRLSRKLGSKLKTLCTSLTEVCYLLKLISPEVLWTAKFIKDVNSLCRFEGVRIRRGICIFTVASFKQRLLFDVKVNLNNLCNINVTDIQVESQIGDVNSKQLLDLFSEAGHEFNFFTNFFNLVNKTFEA